jgi:renalase
MTVAIIGAGIAGLIAAFSLNDRGIKNIVFEKSRGVCGRMATRRYEMTGGTAYVDHGAHHFRSESSIINMFVFGRLNRAEITKIERPIWAFDGQNNIGVGDQTSNSHVRWGYQTGLNTLGRHLVEAGKIEVRREVRVKRIVAEGELRFTLYDESGANLGTYERLIIAIPSIQAADLLANSTIPDDAKSFLSDALRTATYHQCLSVVLGYDRVLQHRPYSALINADRQNDIGWLSFEHEKPNQIPAGNSLLVVQMGPEYSAAHYDEDKETIINAVQAKTQTLLAADLGMPSVRDLQKWRFALPNKTVDAKPLYNVVPGIYFAGDYLRGRRIHLAAETGSEAAAHVALSYRPRR